MPKSSWSPKTFCLVTLGMASLMLTSAPVAAQATPPSTVSQEQLTTLLERVHSLEVEVQQLKEKSAVAPAPAPPAPPPVPEPEASSGSASVPVQLSLLGDVGARASDVKGRNTSFYLGSLDLFMTARASSKVSGLAEVLFITNSDNTTEPDIERLVLQYKASDYFSAGIGRYHTSIGYYNTAFHRGEWFQTAIGRPFMYQFDDTGGVLPLQEIGITTSGQIPSGKLRLGYVAEVGNGRDRLLGGEPAQNDHDANNGKSVNIRLSARPRWVSGLETGFSIYHDYLTFSDGINHSEYISTAYVVFKNSRYELLNEAMLVRHSGSSTGAPGVWHTPAFYTQFARLWGKYRPYFRYEYINAAPDEPIYADPADGTLVGRRNGPSVGLRFDFTEQAAWKIQYDRLAQRGQTPSNGLATQFGFTF